MQGADNSHDSRTLDFGDEDESLPWLESGEDEAQPGFDTTRLIGIGLLMVVALGVIVGAIWWFTNSSVGGGPEADGSLVEAPDEPYRTRPEDAGGKTFAGTGDTSFAVGEGQTREGRLASGPAPAVTPTPTETASEPEPAETPAPRSQALPRGTAVQVGAYSNRADAEEGWRTLTRQTDALSGVDYRIVEGRADIGTVFRLQVAGGDNAGARRLCNALQSDGLPCQIK
ncbi:MAG: SPOR domain-containing protein [Erythrobacter sp.]|nr:SPOR domain-containing protein [Erythrobacter sp.]